MDDLPASEMQLLSPDDYILDQGKPTAMSPPADKPRLDPALSKRRHITSLDKAVSRVHRVIHSREGLDVTLLFAAEATRMVGAVLELFSKAASLRSARAVVALASVLPRPVLRVLAWMFSCRRLAAGAGDMAERLQTLVVILEEWQILSRLWGLLDIWMSTKDSNDEKSLEVDAGQTASRLDTALLVANRISLTSFHVCEATAWLSAKDVLRWPSEAQDRLLGWAAASWGAFTGVELARLLVEWYRRRETDERGEGEGDRREAWRKEFLQNLAWAPLALHWSRLPEGWLPEMVVAGLGLYPAMGYMRDVWREAV